MPEPDARARTTLTAPRVEFDLGALFVGMAGYLAWRVMWWLLTVPFGVANTYSVHMVRPGGGVGVRLSGADALQNEYFLKLLQALPVPYVDQMLGRLGLAPQAYVAGVGPAGATENPALLDLGLTNWGVLGLSVAVLLFWGIVGIALSRLHAVRIARGETLPWDEGFAFAIKQLPLFALAVGFIVGAAACFAGANMAVGAIAAIPWVGAVLLAVLQPLALIASILLVIVVLGGLFGMPVLQSALAVERNGFLDAVSRTYSYLFTRPVTYLVGGLVALVVSGVLLFLGSWMLEYGARITIAFGASWDASAPNAIDLGWNAAKSLGVPSLPAESSGAHSALAWVSWFWFAIAVIAVRGFVLSYLVGAFTDLYLLLRSEVDGTPDSEVWVDDEPGIDFGEPIAGQPEEPAAASEAGSIEP